MMDNRETKKQKVWDRASIEKIMNKVSNVYLKLQLQCYDAKLHESLNCTIDKLEEIESDPTLAEDVSARINNSLVDLMNMRIKLISMMPGSSGGGGVCGDVIEQEMLPQEDQAPNVSEQNQMDVDLPRYTCLYCHKSNHTPEFCQIKTLDQRIRALKIESRCFKCLDIMDSNSTHEKCAGLCSKCYGPHHVSICRQFAKAPELPPHTVRIDGQQVMEPELPEESVRSYVFRTVKHPKTVNIRFPYKVGFEGYHHCQSVTLIVNNKEVVRALVNPTNSDVSLVSPQLLKKLEIKPCHVSEPVVVAKSTIKLRKYAMLDVSSLYRDGFHYKRPFYVFDMFKYRMSSQSVQIRRAVKQQHGIILSNDLAPPTKGHRHIDLVLGSDQLKLFGFTHKLRDPNGISLRVKSPNGESAIVHYTHFGYLLAGSKVIKEQQEKNGDNNNKDDEKMN